ncbi:MAG: prepilin-type N-terminal cleavage/methylation domain-containing protein [Planctomycetes bacterium]|nr:prepilin-type N-terminal cleavage/methylation domain-containing protein [Planctomycetota bacterium]
MNRASRQSARGFTLIEVLVVVIILGIAGAIVVPHMLEAGTLSIQAAARMIISDVLYAQNEAIARQATYKVVFDAANNSYRLTDANDVTLSAAWRGGAFVVDFDQDRRFSGVQITKVDFAGGNTVSFDELGAPSTGGTVELSADGHQYRVTVTAFTGRVTVAPISGG